MSAPSKSRRISFLLGGIAAALAVPVLASFSGKPADGASPEITAAPTLQGGYGRIPLHFEPNLGQTAPGVQYLARGPGYGLFLEPDAVVLGLRQPGAKAAPGAAASTHYVRVQLVSANGKAPAAAEGLLPGHSHYLIGSDPAHWHTQVPQFERVRYRDVYPQVDLVYYGNQQQLEYDFVVAPGGDPQAIRLHYTGIDAASVDAQGALHLRVAGADLVEHKPAVYQTRDGARLPVDGRFSIVQRSDTAIDVAFAVADYDRSRPLIIDPVLSYSTFLGGSISDAPGGIAVDANGRSYITGSTISLDFPTTPGSAQPVSGGQSDAFVAKLSTDGKSLLYSTYLGGSLDDFGNSIAVDATGAAFVLGSTASTDFPATPSAFQKTLNGTGNSDVFVAKLSPDGSSLVYATYLGGTGNDTAAGIVIDGSGAAYVAGQTYSKDFPTVAGAISRTMPGNWDTFVSKLSADGGSLIYSTYLGGANDTPAGIALDATGAAYLTGSATTTFPVTAGAYQTVNAGPRDAFISKISTDGSKFVYSTFLGGSANDSGSGIAVDANGAAYVAGTAASKDFPVTAGAFQKSYIAQVSSVFVSKLSADGSRLVYSTYLSGSQQDSASAIAVDSQGRAYVTGSTQSSNFPITTGAPQVANAGSGDAFVSQLNSTGSALVYSTFLGGSSIDFGKDIAVDAAGNTYVIGQTSSADFPSTAGAFESSFNGSAQEVFAFRFAPFTANPGVLDLGNVAAGTTSLPQTVIFTNNSSNSIGISSISTGTSQFVRAGTTCTTKLAAGASCSVNVKFVAGAVGAATDQLTLITSDGAAVVRLTGFGTGVAASLSPVAVNFSDQLVGTTSSDKIVNITNTGTTQLLVDGITVSAGFNQANTCINISPGATCPVFVQFAPTATGPLSGTLSLSSNAYQAPPPVSLFGNGIAPTVSLSATSLAFGNQSLGTTSAAQVIHLTNSGTGALVISSIGATSPYAQTNTCGQRVDAGAGCDISITFTPGSVGSINGTVTIISNAASSPDLISLSGAGIGPQVSLSPASLAFGNQPINSTSTAQVVTLTNSGTASLAVSSVTASTGFVQTNTCSSVAAGASCSISVSFAPTAAGSLRGTISIATNAAGSPSTVKLSGTGITVPAVSLSATSVNFGSQALGITSAAKAITLTNSGSGALTISGITASAPFAQTNTCGTGLAAGANCAISITYTPVNAVASNGSVTITSNASTSPDTVAVSGTGTGPRGSASPTLISFASQAVGTTSAGRTVTLTNIGNSTLTVSSVTVTSGFTQSTGCSSIAAGKSCSITVKFAPKATGTATGTLTINTNAYDSPSKVSLNGTGT